MGIRCWASDRDGDLDLVETTSEVFGSARDEEIRLHQNQLSRVGGDHHYLVIRPRILGRNVCAIGARVEVQAGGRTMLRWITAGTSYLGQEPAEALFCLGATAVADQVTVFWPGGDQTVLTAEPADQVLTVTQALVFTDGFESGDFASWATTVP